MAERKHRANDQQHRRKENTRNRLDRCERQAAEERAREAVQPIGDPAARSVASNRKRWPVERKE